MEKFNLSEFFSEISYVDSNHIVLEKTNIFKENGEIKKVYEKEEIDLENQISLQKYSNLMAPECGGVGILDLIVTKSKNIKLDFYPKNLLQKIFKSKSEVKNVLTIVEYHLGEPSYFIITSSKNEKLIKKYTKNKTYIIEVYDEFGNNILENKIVIGKKSKITIHNEDVDEYRVCVDLHINFDDFYTITLF
jgi:hypothetical protein